MEKNISALRVDQINLALKQLKIENLGPARDNASEDGADVIGSGAGSASDKAFTQQQATASFHLSILIELIRLQVSIISHAVCAVFLAANISLDHKSCINYCAVVHQLTR